MKDKNRAANQVLADMMFFDSSKRKSVNGRQRPVLTTTCWRKQRQVLSLPFEEPRVCVAG